MKNCFLSAMAATLVLVSAACTNPANESGGLGGGTSPDASVRRFESYLSKRDYESLFPNRYGNGGWVQRPGMIKQDYFSYDNLKKAIYQMANLKYKIEHRDHPEGHTDYVARKTVINKTTGRETVVAAGEGFNASWNLHYPIVTTVVDYGSFLAEGSENDKRRELAAFLANTSHETGGGYPGAPGGHFAWGLHFNEEVGYEGSTGAHYVDYGNADFPPAANRSYHGRGPIQLSWNYNYGLFSAIAYQNKNVLLQNPEMVVSDGVLGFMTGLWFWMTPQAPKPSSHDVITNKVAQKGFGWTIMVINGGLEGNLTESDGRIYSRAGFYRKFAEKLGANIRGEKLDTLGLKPW